MLLPRLTYEPGFLFVVEVWREAVAESAQVSGNNRQAAIVKALRKIKIITSLQLMRTSMIFNCGLKCFL